ncbi:MAG: 5-oxoprolinase subunit PxpA [Chitinophagaceae bacterium]
MASFLIDINCDMGESSALWDYSLQNDLELLQYITSMNLACGYHAGDPATMQQLIQAAKKKQVAIGVHPSYPDRENFGRRSMSLPLDELYDSITDQLNILRTIAYAEDVVLHHVKPHGALYLDAFHSAELANILAQAILDFDPSLILYAQTGSELIQQATQKGLRVAQECFADRTYQSDGQLSARSDPRALITDPEQSLQQAIAIVATRSAVALSGETIPLQADTLCIHGDHAGSLGLAKYLSIHLPKHGIGLQAI